MKKGSDLQNTYLDMHKVVEQKKLEVFNFSSGQEQNHLSKTGSMYRHEADLKSQQELVEKDNLGSKRTVVAAHLNSGIHETVELHNFSRLPKYHKTLNAPTGLSDASFCRLSREKIDKQTAFHNTTAEGAACRGRASAGYMGGFYLFFQLAGGSNVVNGGRGGGSAHGRIEENGVVKDGGRGLRARDSAPEELGSGYDRGGMLLKSLTRRC